MAGEVHKCGWENVQPLMRLLITIAHYFKTETGPDWHHVVGSGRAPLAKIAALNAQIVALHRYFGPAPGARRARRLDRGG